MIWQLLAGEHGAAEQLDHAAAVDRQVQRQADVGVVDGGSRTLMNR